MNEIHMKNSTFTKNICDTIYDLKCLLKNNDGLQYKDHFFYSY